MYTKRTLTSIAIQQYKVDNYFRQQNTFQKDPNSICESQPTVDRQQAEHTIKWFSVCSACYMLNICLNHSMCSVCILTVYCRLTFAYTIWVLLRHVFCLVVNFVLVYCYACQGSLSICMVM